jgi:hypothetical protein
MFFIKYEDQYENTKKARSLKKGYTHCCSFRKSWYQTQLGDYAKQSGVYIHHIKNEILYVGQTSKNKKWGTFHVRLRRECQPKAASNSNLYKLLFQNKQGLKTTLYNFDEIDKMFSGQIKLTQERMTLIVEQYMIAAYKPIGNRK